MKQAHPYYGAYKSHVGELHKLFRHFHQYPELALMEYKTSVFIKEYLEKLGYEVRTVEPTGLIAELPALKDRTKLIVLRAEMDGLPIQENTGLSYASRHEGCMHACGHDAILASALTVARIAAEVPEEFPTAVRFVFEPGEETGEGAGRMIEAGALDGADAFVMFHYATDMPFGMAVHQGQASAMVGGMTIQVHGKASHWCEADKGVDAVYGASRVVEALHKLNESYRGKGPCLAGAGTVHGGEYANIIADHVEIKGTVRACFEEDFKELIERLGTALKQTEEETGTKIELQFPKPPVLPFSNDAGYTQAAEHLGREIFGERFFMEGEDELFLSGDNAYRYFQKVPGIFLVFLAAPEHANPLHHPKFQLDEEILPYSVEMLCRLLKRMQEYR